MRAKLPYLFFLCRRFVCAALLLWGCLPLAARAQADTVRVLTATELTRMYNQVAGKVDSTRRRAIEDSLLIAKYIEDTRAAALAAMPPPKKPSPWDNSLLSKFGFQQISFSNWAAGGNSNITLNGSIDAKANYKKKNIAFENRFQAYYGFVNNFGDINKKSDDRLVLNSKIGYQAVKNLYISAPVEARSQIAPGYNYTKKDTTVISRFLSPLNVTFSVGIDYKPFGKDNSVLSIFYSPVAASLVIVKDSLLRGRYGNKPDELVREAFGSQFKASFNKEVFKNVRVKTDLNLFSDYLNEPKNVQVTWDVTINMTINKFLSADIRTNMIYDDKVMITDKDGNTGPRLQFKEVFGVNFSYTIKNK